MTRKFHINFEIDHIDPLGQGVCKHGENIFFISKTLPLDKGECEIYKKKKKLNWAVLHNPDSLTTKSPYRVNPQCEHFNFCTGCHFQHTDYKTECSFKLQSFKHLAKKILNKNCSIDFIPTQNIQNRFGYRNRIQLHYNKKKNLLGFVSSINQNIIKVPNCIIPIAEIQKSLQKLYFNNSWQDLTIEAPNEGHIEIYYFNDRINISVNGPYAHIGFSQVNSEMNKLLINNLSKELNSIPSIENKTIYDLFGGDGNLSNNINSQKCYIVDSFVQSKTKNNFIACNLFEKDAIKTLQKRIKDAPNILIIDPPRSGFDQLPTYLQTFSPTDIFYVSCSAQTLIRDISLLQATNKEWEINNIKIYDLFPCTFHFETVVHLSRVQLKNT